MPAMYYALPPQFDRSESIIHLIHYLQMIPTEKGQVLSIHLHLCQRFAILLSGISIKQMWSPDLYAD